MTKSAICAILALFLVVGCTSGAIYPLTGSEAHDGDGVQKLKTQQLLPAL